jgi:exonuclease III
MMYIYIIATLNINGIANNTWIRMLEDFLWTNYVDIAMLQEVTSYQVDSVCWYTSHINIGTKKWGTVILTKEGLSLTQI